MTISRALLQRRTGLTADWIVSGKAAVSKIARSLKHARRIFAGVAALSLAVEV